jgi:hypothetical protein
MASNEYNLSVTEAPDAYKLAVVDGTKLTLTLNMGLTGPAGPVGPVGPTGPAGATNLSELDDVDLSYWGSYPDDGAILRWDSPAEKWVSDYKVDDRFIKGAGAIIKPSESGWLQTPSLQIFNINNPNGVYAQLNSSRTTTENTSFTLPNESGIIATNNTAVMLTGPQQQFIFGEKYFNNNVVLYNQDPTNPASALSVQNGDSRYGTYTTINNLAVFSYNADFQSAVSIVLPIGRYQIDAFLASSHVIGVGCKIRFSTSKDIKVGITDNYGRPSVAAFSWPIIEDNYNNTSPYAIRSDSAGTEFRRTITGIIEVLETNTVLSLDYAQLNANSASPSSCRKRSHILARRIN